MKSLSLVIFALQGFSGLVWAQEAGMSTPLASDVAIRGALTEQLQALKNRLAEGNATLQAIQRCHEPSPTVPVKFYGRISSTATPGCVDPLALVTGVTATTVTVATPTPFVSPGYAGPAFVPSEYIGVAHWDNGLVNEYNRLRTTVSQNSADAYLLNHYRNHGVIGGTRSDGSSYHPRLPGYQKSPWTEQKYLASNPDVRDFLRDNPGMTALDHYKNYGIFQGRAWCCIEDWRRPARPTN